MNREIKFRAWFKVQKKMVYNLGFDQFSFKTIDDLNGTEYMPSVYDMDIEKYDDNGELIGYEATFNFEVMQYTGLKDKNGKEVYEGDICRQNNNDIDLTQVCFGNFGVIDIETETFIDEAHGWYLKVIPTDEISKMEPFCNDMTLNEQWIGALDIEVIGNIFENPKLLDIENETAKIISDEAINEINCNTCKHETDYFDCSQCADFDEYEEGGRDVNE